jgi:hypothetical protein
MFGMLKNDAGASLTQPSEPAHGTWKEQLDSASTYNFKLH